MKRYLQPGYKFSLNGIDGYFEIKDIIGCGSSCVVYSADFTDKNGICTEHLLKEYNPKTLDIARDESGAIFVDNSDDVDAFEKGLVSFEKGYNIQLEIRRNLETKNTTANIQGIHEGNGTKYIDMTLFSGKTLDEVDFKSLYDLIKCIKSISKVISNYHSKGYLHLDIKPKNVFVIPETPDIVMLFDFDSVTMKQDVISGSNLSYTKNWCAPEQIVPGRAKLICESTDIFAIGEILFWEIFGRHSTAIERRSFSEYSFNKNSFILRDIDEIVYKKLSIILNKTICNSVANRFKSALELIDALDDLIPHANPDLPTLVSKLPALEKKQVYSEREYNYLDTLISENNNIFLSGSFHVSLVLEYILNRTEKFNKIIHLICFTNLFSMITDDKMLVIRNCSIRENETKEDYCRRKLSLLSRLVEPNDLIVICNYSNATDPLLENIKELKCKVIFLSNENLDGNSNSNKFDLPELMFRNRIISIIKEELIADENLFSEVASGKIYFPGKKITNSLINTAQSFDVDIDNVLFYTDLSKDCNNWSGILITNECWYGKTKWGRLNRIPYSEIYNIKRESNMSDDCLIDINGNNCGPVHLPYHFGSVSTIQKILWYYHNQYKPKRKNAINIQKKEEIFENYVFEMFEKSLVGRGKRYPANRTFTQKTGMPNSIYKAVSKYARGVDISDVILYIDGGFGNGIIISCSGYYFNLAFGIKCSFLFSEAKELHNDGNPQHFAFYYFDKEGKRRIFFPPDGGEKGFEVLSKIVKKYHELLPGENDQFNKDGFTKFNGSL